MSIPLTNGQRWSGFLVAVSISAMTNLDLTKVIAALPAIDRSFDAGSAVLQLIFAGYVLTFGLFLVPMGRLGDLGSRKKFFITGLSLFLVGSVLCAVAPSVEYVIAGRLLQGVGAGVQMPQIVGLAQAYFRGPERARAFGIFGAVVGVSVAAGPVVGGALMALGGPDLGWRLVFLINVPLCLVAMAGIIWILREVPSESEPAKGLDLVGVALLGGATFSLMGPFLLTTGTSSDSEWRWLLLIPSAVLLVLFVRWERWYASTGRVPIIQPALLRIDSYRHGTIVGAVYFAAYPSLFLLTGLYLQLGLGMGAAAAGSVNVGYALGSAAASWVGGLLIIRVGRRLVTVGLCVVLVCTLGLILVAELVPPGAVLPVMAGVMTIAGLGGGLVISPNQTLSLADVPVRDGGLAGSIGQLGQRVGTAIGSAVAVAMFYAIVRDPDGALQPARSADGFALAMLVLAGIIVVAVVISATAGRRAHPRA